MCGEAAILHADLDAFYASVEQRDDPRLRGKPVLVGGGVVLACSYEAKRRGVKTAMGGNQARRLCPDAIVVKARMEAYSEASKAVFKIFEQFAPVVEGISIDEAFLDVRGLEHIKGTPMQIARDLRRQVREQAGLPITVGIARTKHLAKVASAVAKPDGLLLVPPDGEEAFLHPLPVERLWGVGPKTTAKLHARDITKVGQLARMTEADLIDVLGRGAGRHIHALANNRDPRRVRTRSRRRSMGSQRALGRRAPKTWAFLDESLVAIVDRLSRRMRGAHRVCRTVTLRLRFDDFERATRSHTLSEATCETGVLLGAARDLMAAAQPLIRQRGITLIGITFTGLEDAGAVQLSLPLPGGPEQALDAAVDDIRERFGAVAITRAVLVGKAEDLTVPLLSGLIGKIPGVPLVDPAAAFFAIVDAQPGFTEDDAMDAEARAKAALAVDRIAWLAGFAGMLDIPVVVVEEAPEQNGATHERIRERVPEGSPVETKPAFGLTGCPAIVRAIERTGRRTAVIAGFETDVCVAQSAIGLQDQGYRVVVLEDACYSTTATEHGHGMARMTHCGVEPNSFKGVIFEWLETVERAEELFGAAEKELGNAPLRDPG